MTPLRPPRSPQRNTHHKARVVGDLVGAASLAAQDMPAQCRATALFDGRHDLELTQAQVAALFMAPGGPVGAEDVGDFQGGSPHGIDLWGGQKLQRTHHLAQHRGGHMRVNRCRLQLLVPEQHLDHTDVDLLLQQMGGEGVPQ